MRGSVGIIGTGWVGASVAISLLHTGVARELWLHDQRDEVAEGEAMDLAHGAAFYEPAAVGKASIDEMASRCDVIVVCAGRGGTPGESRLALLNDNASIVRAIGARLRSFRGMVVMVSNPVDVLTYVMTESSGLPPARVIGTGTMLDTARLRQMLGRRLRVEPRSIHAQVIGEHGDSEVVIWSGAECGGRPLREWAGWTGGDEIDTATEVRAAAYEIIRRKGATNHAIGLATAALLKWLLRGDRRVLTVTRVHASIEGIEDVALSLPTIVGEEGAVTIVTPAMDDAERAALHRSASTLRTAIESVRKPS